MLVIVYDISESCMTRQNILLAAKGLYEYIINDKLKIFRIYQKLILLRNGPAVCMLNFGNILHINIPQHCYQESAGKFTRSFKFRQTPSLIGKSAYRFKWLSAGRHYNNAHRIFAE
ncbi:MAG: hypothetical protein K6G50_02460 [bacterium]|nr:hypothetical protein [bacterium]